MRWAKTSRVGGSEVVGEGSTSECIHGKPITSTTMIKAVDSSLVHLGWSFAHQTKISIQFRMKEKVKTMQYVIS